MGFRSDVVCCDMLWMISPGNPKSPERPHWGFKFQSSKVYCETTACINKTGSRQFTIYLSRKRRYLRLIRPRFPLQGIASLHWVCQGVLSAPAICLTIMIGFLISLELPFVITAYTHKGPDWGRGVFVHLQLRRRAQERATGGEKGRRGAASYAASIQQPTKDGRRKKNVYSAMNSSSREEEEREKEKTRQDQRRSQLCTSHPGTRQEGGRGCSRAAWIGSSGDLCAYGNGFDMRNLLPYGCFDPIAASARDSFDLTFF